MLAGDGVGAGEEGARTVGVVEGGGAEALESAGATAFTAGVRLVGVVSGLGRLDVVLGEGAVSATFGPGEAGRF